jgi:hypothetical protein
MRLDTRLVNVEDLTPSERDEMGLLMERHYANVHRHVFEADLAGKRWVILVSDPLDDRLCGFSTQQLLDVTVHQRTVKVLFSGDTIIGREHWGDQALSQTWGRLALSLIDANPGAELYWFLISQGYRTYRFLPVFFHEYYPRHDRSTPAWAVEVLDAAAGATFPGRYDAEAGVIRASEWQYRLRAGLAEVTPERLKDPQVRFFQDRNPSHSLGDELCCLAPLTRANFTRAAYRVIGAEPRERIPS